MSGIIKLKLDNRMENYRKNLQIFIIIRLPSDWMQVASIALGLNTQLKIGNIPNALRWENLYFEGHLIVILVTSKLYKQEWQHS